MVDVLVGQDHQLDVLEPVTELGDPALQDVERCPGVRPRVHERQRVVLDQVHVDPADRERGRDREAVDARLRGRGEGIVRCRASIHRRFDTSAQVGPPFIRSSYGRGPRVLQSCAVLRAVDARADACRRSPVGGASRRADFTVASPVVAGAAGDLHLDVSAVRGQHGSLPATGPSPTDTAAAAGPSSTCSARLARDGHAQGDRRHGCGRDQQAGDGAAAARRLVHLHARAPGGRAPGELCLDGERGARLLDQLGRMGLRRGRALRRERSDTRSTPSRAVGSTSCG